MERQIKQQIASKQFPKQLWLRTKTNSGIPSKEETTTENGGAKGEVERKKAEELIA